MRSFLYVLFAATQVRVSSCESHREQYETCAAHWALLASVYIVCALKSQKAWFDMWGKTCGQQTKTCDVIFQVHFDCLSRREAAGLIRRKLGKRAGAVPIVIGRTSRSKVLCLFLSLSRRNFITLAALMDCEATRERITSFYQSTP